MRIQYFFNLVSYQKRANIHKFHPNLWDFSDGSQPEVIIPGLAEALKKY